MNSGLDPNHRKRVLVFLNLLANPASSDRFSATDDPRTAAIELCRVWIEDIYLPGIRNLDGLKHDRSREGTDAFDSAFSPRELELLYQFHRFLELRLEMFPKHRPEEREFPEGEFWKNIFRHARNVLDEIDPERLELDTILTLPPLPSP
jgi:hypothetical protein